MATLILLKYPSPFLRSSSMSIDSSSYALGMTHLMKVRWLVSNLSLFMDGAKVDVGLNLFWRSVAILSAEVL